MIPPRPTTTGGRASEERGPQRADRSPTRHWAGARGLAARTGGATGIAQPSPDPGQACGPALLRVVTDGFGPGFILANN